jgi:hypothetical protein
MKTKLFSFLALCLLLSCKAQAQILYDDFNGSSINTSLWQTSTPFSDSSITESGGSAVFQNRGRIITINALPTVLDITGSFEFTGNIHDSFYVMTRTDGISTQPWGGFDHGIGFGFEIQNDLGQTANNIWITDNDYSVSSADLTRGTYSLSLNTLYNFRITDNGNNLALYIGDLTTPLLTASDSSVYGNQVALNNREGTGGGSSISAGSMVKLDYLNIQAVPEPSTAWLALVGGLGASFLRWRKSAQDI